jgi:hypothetical protein
MATRTLPIRLIELADRVDAEELLALTLPGGTLPDLILACDFYVDGIEPGGSLDGIRVAGGYQHGRIVNVDHHAPTEEMRQRISSTTLALERMSAATASLGSLVVIHHTDCDSILSAGILAGRIAPDPTLNEAAIAADHTGAANHIADLLQALDRERDVEFSIRNLKALLDGRTLEPRAASLLSKRHERRRAAAAAVANGAFNTISGVYYGVFTPKLEGEFFPSLLPKAKLILAIEPIAGSRWVVKIRLGHAAPEWLTLDDLRLREYDRGWGGRWNAGGNGRTDGGGSQRGTTIPPNEYAAAIAARLEEFTSARVECAVRADAPVCQSSST